MVIFADHLEVPSSTLCLIVFICCAWMALLITNTSLISSKISGLFLSLIFILSFMAIMIFWVRSSAPCLELFSAAPNHLTKKYMDLESIEMSVVVAVWTLQSWAQNLTTSVKYFLGSTHAVNSQHSAILGTSHGISPHTQSNACLGGQFPTTVPHTHSNMLV